MQQEGEEPDPLFYNLPLPRLLNWNRWWHIVAKTVQLVLQEEDLGSDRVASQAQERELILRVLYVSESSGISRELGAQAH